MIKKIIGYVLISSPFVALGTFAYFDDSIAELLIALGIFGVVFVFASLFYLGLYLISRRG